MGCGLSLASSEPDAGISNVDGHFSQGFYKGRERESYGFIPCTSSLLGGFTDWMGALVGFIFKQLLDYLRSSRDL